MLVAEGLVSTSVVRVIIGRIGVCDHAVLSQLAYICNAIQCEYLFLLSCVLYDTFHHRGQQFLLEIWY